MSLRLTKKEETGVFEAVMPWLRPTGEATKLVKDHAMGFPPALSVRPPIVLP
ncbi:hypothetical protein HEK616_84450 (plasmid) [Streptomyces nigrescens]|uniref:Uncharacterized protein n=1 Tax=Streptomyces nigrescens TaxID=1920 RepID=A0ABM8A896_STRNI|nr:hypothetical protein [Streptomyces nigrescens]BDM74958.1 hypothetical protein HEK616_84450 [Streptomyces nigrescens]